MSRKTSKNSFSKSDYSSKCGSTSSSLRSSSRSATNHLKTYGQPDTNDNESTYSRIRNPTVSSNKFKKSRFFKNVDGFNTSSTVKKIMDESEIYAVILPLVVDNMKRNMQQPVLVLFDKNELEILGVTIDFDFLDDELNLFCSFIKYMNISYRIVALGESVEQLKVSLEKSISMNSSWKNMKKLIEFTSEVLKIDQDPSIYEEDSLPYVEMKTEELIDLFANHEDQSKTNEHLFLDEENDVSVLAQGSKDEESKLKRVKSGSHSDKEKDFVENEISVSEEKDSENSTSKKKIKLKEVKSKIDELKKRKAFISEIENSGVVLRQLIDVLDDIFNFLMNKYVESNENSREIPKSDETYKIQSKNLIFLEGKLQLPLDSYNRAIKLSKPSNPFSIAYQIVRLAFPRSYFQNATLGKKYYTPEELNTFISAIERKDSSEKIPLAIVFGYQDPLNKRFHGKFDYNLGQARVDSFIDHIFRKAGLFKYSEQDFARVRARIIRVLCFLNKEKRKKSTQANSLDTDDNYTDGIFSSEIFSQSNMDE